MEKTKEFTSRTDNRIVVDGCAPTIWQAQNIQVVMWHEKEKLLISQKEKK